jgi:hypothetical protein
MDTIVGDTILFTHLSFIVSVYFSLETHTTFSEESIMAVSDRYLCSSNPKRENDQTTFT